MKGTVEQMVNQFKKLKDGWMNNVDGVAPKHEGLDWFVGIIPATLPTPYLYPTPDGGIQAEWTLPLVKDSPLGTKVSKEISLEINLETHMGDWHSLNMDTDEEETKTLDLDKDSSWEWIRRKLA